MSRITYTDSEFAGILVILFAVFMIAIGPLITLWGWNQLFGSIHYLEYTFGNWLGVLIMGMFFRGVKIEKAKA